MNDFIEKWNNDSRFKTKVKLVLSSLFVVFVAIFAITSNGISSETNMSNQNKINVPNEMVENENHTIKIPEEYNYKINILVNNEEHSYSGIKKEERETITKNSNEIITDYIYQDGNYYKKGQEQYTLTTKEEVYDIISESYLKLEVIEKYLEKSIKDEKINKVYLKDILYGNDSNEYIEIELNENIIKINYTSLIKEFNKLIESFIVEIKVEEIE